MQESTLKENINLEEGSVSETLFIPLCVKAKETNCNKSVLKDSKAIEITQKLQLDFKKFDGGSLTHQGIVARTWLIDKSVANFLETSPNACIINLGCGLDTRISRIDNNLLSWYDIDLPEVIKLRKQFFNECDRIKFISKSIFDFSWIDDIKVNNNILFIAEGLFVYFTEVQLKSIFNVLTTKFPGAHMFLTTVNKHVVGKGITAKFTWGINNAKEIESLNENIVLVESWNSGDFFKNRLSPYLRILNRILPGFRSCSQVLHIKFK